MPKIVHGNTGVPAIMIGEKASDIIKESINCYNSKYDTDVHYEDDHEEYQVFPDFDAYEDDVKQKKSDLPTRDEYEDDYEAEDTSTVPENGAKYDYMQSKVFLPSDQTNYGQDTVTPALEFYEENKDTHGRRKLPEAGLRYVYPQLWNGVKNDVPSMERLERPNWIHAILSNERQYERHFDP